MLKRFAFFVVLCSSIQGYAQGVSSRSSPNLVASGKLELPINSATQQVAYSEKIAMRGLPQTTLHQRGKRWLSQIPAAKRQEQYFVQESGELTRDGEQEYTLLAKGLSIPYKLHYKVALYAALGGYRYDISSFLIELYPDDAHPKPAFFPLEKYLEAVFIPHSVEEQMVAQFKQHVDDCAYKLSESIKLAMAKSGEDATIPSHATVRR